MIICLSCLLYSSQIIRLSAPIECNGEKEIEAAEFHLVKEKVLSYLNKNELQICALFNLFLSCFYHVMISCAITWAKVK